MDRKREQQLITKAQRGDKKAFAALYRAHVDAVYRYLSFRVDAVETAEDLTADVFLRMLEGLPNYQDQGVPLLAWLYRIAHARLVDHYRRSKHADATEDIDAADPGVDEDMDEPIELEFTAEALKEGLKTLTESQRRVLILRFIDGLNLEQTARAMDKNVDSIKALQYRALQALRQALLNSGFRAHE
ncbi:MAG: sigma-70 family RNA polymerase sigma factor [Anaerolineae bacterium]|nr:sigma-70 family RNA polymerase sigma factor [Anaerolineae bacterium]